MRDEEAMLSDKGKRILSIFNGLSGSAQDLLLEYAEKLAALERTLREEVSEPAQEPQEKTDDGKGANPIHDKRRG